MQYYLNALPASPAILRKFLVARRNQWLSPERIEDMQSQALRRLLDHSYRTVPFYRRLLSKLGIDPSEIRGIDGLEKLPVVTRGELMAGFPEETVSRALPSWRTTRISTGGSTGVPLTVYVDRSSVPTVEAGNIRFRSWYGWHYGDREVALWGHPIDIARGRSLKNVASDIVLQRRLLSAFEMTPDILEHYCRFLARFRPVLIRGYTTSLLLLCETVLRKRYKISPAAVVAEAETLLPSQRRKLSEAFGCDVFSFYGSREIPTIAQDCKEHAGLHVNAECRIIEIVRGSKRVSQGELGRVLITDLTNYATPLIRYENGDMGRASNDQCNCGRGLPLLGEILGRVTDLVVTPEGRIISGVFFPHLFKDYLWVREFYVEQPCLEELDISLVPSVPREEVSLSQLEGLRKTLRLYVGPTIAIRIELVQSIPRPASGKHIPVKSQVGAALLRQESFEK